MKRQIIGLAIPLGLVGLAVLISFRVFSDPAIHRAVLVGVGLAILQSTLSVGLMKWAWDKKIFYWIWGGGFLFRILVFAGSAFVVLKFTSLSLAAVLIPMVLATMVFIVSETSTLFWKK